MVETSRRDVSRPNVKTFSEHRLSSRQGRKKERTAEMEVINEQTVKGYELKECLGDGPMGQSTVQPNPR